MPVNQYYGLLHPCMGFYLQGSVKAIAAFEVGLQLALTAYSSVDYWTNYPDVVDEYYGINAGQFWGHTGTMAFSYVYKAASIFVAVWLFFIVSQRNRRRLIQWLTIRVILYLLWVTNFLVKTFLDYWGHEVSLTELIGLLVYSVYRGYTFWVIWSFIRHIKESGAVDKALCILRDEDLDEFFDGNSSDKRNSFLSLPYQKDFEIDFANLDLDKSDPLGAGNFGIVYRANLKRCNEGMNSLTIVAVKTVPTGANVAYLKALLRELQILNYIGTHENIVSLVGASTSNVKQGELYVVVEYCNHGSLLSYIRTNKQSLASQPDTIYPDLLRDYMEQDTFSLGIKDLLRWSMETAAGMEYIASKNVIHGDLAARNVLLSINKTAKIADFGLSRQLYRYTTYTKQSKEPLPWRWMAVESLCEMKFSSSSDTWAFGMTIWEYFSGGDVPFGGHEFSTEFIDALRYADLRPSRPAYSSQDIYSLMRQCWNLDPAERPSFQELRNFFDLKMTESVAPDFLVENDSAHDYHRFKKVLVTQPSFGLE